MSPNSTCRQQLDFLHQVQLVLFAVAVAQRHRADTRMRGRRAVSCAPLLQVGKFRQPGEFGTLSRYATCDPYVARCAAKLVAFGFALSAINNFERSTEDSDMHCELVCTTLAQESGKNICSGTNGHDKIRSRYAEFVSSIISGAFATKSCNAPVKTKLCAVQKDCKNPAASNFCM